MTETIQGNKLIAEFYGCNYYIDEAMMKIYYDDDSMDGIAHYCEWHPEYNGKSNVLAWIFMPDQNWCQLMPAVQKCGKLLNEKDGDYLFTLYYSINKALLELDVKAVWQAVVKFITHYNERTKA